MYRGWGRGSVVGGTVACAAERFTPESVDFEQFLLRPLFSGVPGGQRYPLVQALQHYVVVIWKWISIIVIIRT